MAKLSPAALILFNRVTLRPLGQPFPTFLFPIWAAADGKHAELRRAAVWENNAAREGRRRSSGRQKITTI